LIFCLTTAQKYIGDRGLFHVFETEASLQSALLAKLLVRRLPGLSGLFPRPWHYVTPKSLNGGSETLLRCFTNKTDILSIKLCYKDSLCEKRLFVCLYRVVQKCNLIILRIKLDVNRIAKTKQALRCLSAIAELHVFVTLHCGLYSL